MQRSLENETKTLLINQILPLASIHLLESHTSRVIYDRCLLAVMSLKDLSEILTFLEGLQTSSLAEMPELKSNHFSSKDDGDSLDVISFEYVDISNVELSDLTRREFYPE